MNNLFPNNVLQTIILIVTGMLLTAPAVFLSETYFKSTPSDIKDSLIFIVLCFAIILIARIINIRRRVNQEYNFKIPKKIYGLVPLSIVIITIYQIGINIPFSNMVHLNLTGKYIFSNPFDELLLSIGAILFAPLFEEIIFRGIILKGLLTRYKPLTSIIVSGIIFAAIHAQPALLLNALLFGLCVGWIYYRTKSLGFCILLHFCSNLLSQMVSYLLVKSNLSADHVKNYIYGPYTFLIIAICLLTLLFAALTFYNKLRKMAQ